MAKNIMGLKTKSMILDAAQAVFKDAGFEDSKVEDIAARAGVTKTMIYYHFDSKEALMVSLIERLLSGIQQMLPLPEDGQSAINPAHLRSHLEKMLTLWEGHQEIAAFMLSRGFKDPQLFRKLQEIGTPFFNRVIRMNSHSSTINQKQIFDLFFFNALPMMSYPLMKEQFAAAYGMSTDQMDEQFINKFMQILNQSIAA